MTYNRVLLPTVSNSPRLQIEYVPLAALNLNAPNPRQHGEKQITNIAKNIDLFGFVVPCLVDDDNRVLAGNARIAAAALLGMATVPVVRLRHLGEPEKRAFIIADNRLPELASWDQESAAAGTCLSERPRYRFRLHGHRVRHRGGGFHPRRHGGR